MPRYAEVFMCVPDMIFVSHPILLQVHGSYAAMHGGFSHEALSDLTGAPCEVMHFHQETSVDLDAETVFRRIQEGLKFHLPIAASTGAGITEVDAAASARGLEIPHVYTVLEAVNIPSVFPLIRLRNPWGSHKFQLLHDDIAQIPADLWRDLRARAVDGSFWIPSHELVGLFGEVVICLRFEDWSELRYVDQFNPKRTRDSRAGTSVVAYDIVPLQASTRVLASITIQSERGTPVVADAGFLASALTPSQDQDVVVFQPPLVRQVSGAMLTLPSCNIAIDTEAIRLHPLSFTACGEPVPFVLSLYSDGPVVVRRVAPDLDSAESRQRVARALRDACDADRDKSTQSFGATDIVTWRPRDVGVSDSVAGRPSVSTFFLCDNRRGKRSVLARVSLSNVENMVSSRDPHGETNEVQDIVPPGSFQLLLVLSSFSETLGHAYQVSYVAQELMRTPKRRQPHVPTIPPGSLDLYTPVLG
jgi:Calpain family cysteine protease